MMGISLKTTATGKVLASLALVGAAAGVAGLGTYGTFGNSTSSGAKVASGNVRIDLGPAGTVYGFDVVAGGLVPGDTVQRVATLSNTGDQGLAGISLTTRALSSSMLDTDAANGLQIAVDSCSTGWTESGIAPGVTYACPVGATLAHVLLPQPMIGADVPLANLLSITPGRTDNLRFTGSLPQQAGNGLQGKTSTINFSFTATARVAGSK